MIEHLIGDAFGQFWLGFIAGIVAIVLPSLIALAVLIWQAPDLPNG